MNLRHAGISSWLLALLAGAVGAQEAPPFPRDPVVWVQAGGPTAAVNALAFAPDGQTLYAAGYDKVVRAWAREKGAFALKAVYRVPVGPGAGGAINALALSPDGRWLAAGGAGLVRGATGFRQTGFVMPVAGALSPEMLQDQGTIYLFDTTVKDGVRALRGHRGPVLSMTFAPGRKGKPPLLVSLAREPGGSGHRGALRLWDAAGKELAQLAVGDDPGDTRPGLAAWHTGAGVEQLAVALAVGDQPLRVWYVAKKKLREAEPKPAKGAMNWTAAFAADPAEPTRGTLLTGHFAAPGARLRRWRVDGAADPKPLDERPALLAKGRRVAALAARPGAAVAVLQDTRNEFRLYTVRLGRDGAAVPAAGVPLWSGSHLPALAVSPDGKSVAVASNDKHEVLVFPAADLVAGRSPKPERLLSDAVPTTKVAFARRGKDRGLLLTEPGQERVFDFDGRLTPGRGKWEPESSPAAKRWAVKETARKRGAGEVAAYEVAGPGVKKEVVLQAGQRPTAHALLPPCPPLKTPLLAVGYVELGVPYLALYDVLTGRPCRHYSGHVGPVRSLAFAEDGRLLASAADDKTVSVWSLTDLGETLHKRGTLAGLAVDQGAAAKGRVDLPIARLDAALLSKANAEALKDKKVQEGDVIEGVVGDEGLRAFSSPRAFYEALWRTTPGTKVTLQVRDKGRVPLTVDQGIDDHSPLFSLFLARIGGAARWLVWSPSGPYDTGDARLEGRMGWHRNPAKPGSPVEYDRAGKYRKEYRRDGIARHLVKHCALAPALADWDKEPVPRPGLSLGIDEVGADPARDGRGRPIIRKGRLTLRAGVFGVAPSKVREVQWQLDGGPRRDFTEAFDLEQTADLGGEKWKRGPHELRLIVTTIDAAEHIRSLTVHYVPLAPAVAFDAASLKKEFGDPVPERPRVKRPDLEVAAGFTPGDNGPDGPEVRASLRLNGAAVKGVTTAGRALRGKVTLQPGLNVLEVRAVNEGAAPDLPYESASRRLVVEYAPAKASALRAPQIILEAVQPDGGEGLSLLPLPAKPVVVAAAAVRVRGRVRADEPLTEVTLEGRPVEGFKPGRDIRTFEIDITLKLKPGPRTLKFTARAGKGKPVEQGLALAYHPEVPRVEAAEPRALRRRPGEPPDFDLQLRLTAPKGAFPYTAGVRVNGAKEEVRAEVSEGALAARVKLRPRHNTLLVVLRNKYTEHAEEVTVYCPQPPAVESLPAPRVGAGPLVDLVAKVRTPKGLPPLGARLNGREVRKDGLTLEATTDPEVWTVRVHKVAIVEGDNALSLAVRNEDGQGPPRAVRVLYKPAAAPAAARVEVLEPRRDAAVSEPTCTLRFRVRSASKAEVRVFVNDRRVPEGKPVKADGALVYELAVAGLREGPNALAVEVTNAGGKTAVTAPVVSYTPPWAVDVRFDRLQREDNKQFLPLDAKAPVGNLVLHGHVVWRQADDPHLRRPVRVRVWVNDFEQAEAKLEPAKGRRREFRARVRLNGAQNQLRVQLPPSLKLRANAAPAVAVACARPESGQRLHLVVFGPGQDEKRLAEAVRKAFLVEAKAGRLQTPAFREVTLTTLPRKARQELVYPQLDLLAAKLRDERGPLNDVIVVFFSGEEAVSGKGHYLLTETSQKVGRLRETALECGAIREQLGKVPGAKLLLLDVHRGGRAGEGTELPGGTEFPHLGFYRYVWLGKEGAPEKARLVHALGESLRRAPLVRDHLPHLEGWAVGLGKGMAYFKPETLPRGLEQLRLGQVARE